MSDAAKRRARRYKKRAADLRDVLRDVLMDGVQDCDGFDPDGVTPCECSTARARRLIGDGPWPPPAKTVDDLPPIPACGKCGETWECECRPENAVVVRLTLDTSKFDADMDAARAAIERLR